MLSRLPGPAGSRRSGRRSSRTVSDGAGATNVERAVVPEDIVRVPPGGDRYAQLLHDLEEPVVGTGYPDPGASQDHRALGRGQPVEDLVDHLGQRLTIEQIAFGDQRRRGAVPDRVEPDLPAGSIGVACTSMGTSIHTGPGRPDRASHSDRSTTYRVSSDRRAGRRTCTPVRPSTRCRPPGHRVDATAGRSS